MQVFLERREILTSNQEAVHTVISTMIGDRTRNRLHQTEAVTQPPGKTAQQKRNPKTDVKKE